MGIVSRNEHFVLNIEVNSQVDHEKYIGNVMRQLSVRPNYGEENSNTHAHCRQHRDESKRRKYFKDGQEYDAYEEMESREGPAVGGLPIAADKGVHEDVEFWAPDVHSSVETLARVDQQQEQRGKNKQQDNDNSKCNVNSMAMGKHSDRWIVVVIIRQF